MTLGFKSVALAEDQVLSHKPCGGSQPSLTLVLGVMDVFRPLLVTHMHSDTHIHITQRGRN